MASKKKPTQAAGVSLKGFIDGYPYLKESLNSLAARESSMREAMRDTDELAAQATAGADPETRVLGTLAVQQLPDDDPFTTGSTLNRFAMLVWKMLDACESGSIGGDACRMADVVNAAVCDVVGGSGTNNAVRFELGIGLVAALLNHGLHSWIQRGDPDQAQRDLNRLGKMLEGVFKVPEATLATLGISPALRNFGISSCEGLKKHFKQEAHEYSNNLKFKYIVVPRAKKPAAAATNAATPSTASDKSSKAKRPLEFPEQGATPSKKAKKAGSAATVPAVPELREFTHPAAAKIQEWITALGDVKQLQKGAWQLRCTSHGRLRVLMVTGSANLFALNRTVAEAFGWGVGIFEHSVNKGTAPPLSGFLVDPPVVEGGRAIVGAKRSADSMAGAKGTAFLAERAVKVCQVFRGRGDTLTYKCGDNTASVTLDGIDAGKSRIPLPRCVGADASLGSSSVELASNRRWARLNDSFRGDRKGESLIFGASESPESIATCFMNYARRPIFDNTGARFGAGALFDRTPLPTALEKVSGPFAQ